MSRASKLKKHQAADIAAFLSRVAKLPPEERRELLQNLRDPSGQARKMFAAAGREIRRAERLGCSMSVVKATTRGGEPLVVAGRARSSGRSRIGDAEGTRPTRRLVPPQAVALEDRYDLMTRFEAQVCTDPPSVTGVQLQTLRNRTRGVETSAPRINSPKRRKSPDRSVKRA